MLTQNENGLIKDVYEKIIKGESREWSEIDNLLETLEYLDEDQICREVDVLFEYHSRGKLTCQEDQADRKHVIPAMTRAVNLILTTYKDTGKMDAKSRYILEYYLVLSQVGVIVCEDAD